MTKLSICWNDAFRKIFHFKRFEFVRSLQVEFGTVDFQHLYDLHRWEFSNSVADKCQYSSQFFYMLEVEYHICDELFDKNVVRTGFNRSFKAGVFNIVVVSVSLLQAVDPSGEVSATLVLLLHSARFSASSTLSCRSSMLCLTTSSPFSVFLCSVVHLRLPPRSA